MQKLPGNMAEEATSLTAAGTSIPVSNVQALAASINAAAEHSTVSVPLRYIRPDAAAVPVAAHGEADQFPVVDFARLVDPRFSLEESAKLHKACVEWGFFQLINHQVPDGLIERMKADVVEFFQLPLEEKEAAVAQLPNSLEGYGQAFVVSEEQKLDWGDMLYIITRPLQARNMRFWPPRPLTYRPQFNVNSTSRDTLSSYSLEMKRVAATLLEHIAKTLGVAAAAELLDIFRDFPQGVRINYYPPCPNADQVLGLSPHTDATVALTLLLQVNDVQGLQIKNEGKWFPVRPLPGALIVNVGDVLEMLSNGEYKSIEHRAVINAEEERLSMATFLLATEDAKIGPLPGLATGSKVKYKTIGYADMVKAFFSSKLDGNNLLESFKLYNNDHKCS